MNSILISVIIPVYNAMPYLSECLNSLLNQSFSDFEILCVNDGSNDSSKELLCEYSAKSEKIRVIEQENQGAGKARNVGLRYATGKYVIFLDADDFFECDLLKKVYLKAERTDSEIVIFDIFRFDNVTKELKTPKMSLNKKYIPEVEVFSRVDIPEHIFNISLGVAYNKLYQKKFLTDKKLQFQEIRNSNTVYFSFAALLCANRISVVNERLLYYRSNNPKSTVGRISESPTCFIEAWRKIYSMVLHNNDSKIYKSFVTAFCAYSKRRLSEYKTSVAFNEAFYCLKKSALFEFGLAEPERTVFLSDEMYQWSLDILSLDDIQYKQNYSLNIS